MAERPRLDVRVLAAIAIASAALTALSIVTIDRPIARVLAQYEPAAFWNRGTDIVEYVLGLPLWLFASPVLLVAGMLVVMIVPRWRHHARTWIVVAGTHVVCRFVTVKIKDATGRLRPKEWLAREHDETFGWEDGIAFPSGHVTLFASVFVPLAILVPRARPLLAIPLFICIARVAVNAHWISDVLGGIALVAIVAWALASACGDGARARDR